MASTAFRSSAELGLTISVFFARLVAMLGVGENFGKDTDDGDARLQAEAHPGAVNKCLRTELTHVRSRKSSPPPFGVVSLVLAPKRVNGLSLFLARFYTITGQSRISSP